MLNRLKTLPITFYLGLLALSFAAEATLFSYLNNYIIAYGDAESHLNIAKRVVSSITPGFAQLGGIWLPLPHLLMVPFVAIDKLWQSGLAGSIVSGIAYVISSIFIFKLVRMLCNNLYAALIAFLVFTLNPNVLYMQSTPMSELPLIAFFILSTYYFFKFLKNTQSYLSLILAAFFGFCATLSRYDGWFLVLMELGLITLLFFGNFFKSPKRSEIEGKIILFSTLAFFGIFIWMLWDFLILGDPFYFTNSQFSANSQQQGWYQKGELHAFRNLPLAFWYYFVTAMDNSGILIFSVAIIALLIFLTLETDRAHLLFVGLLLVPFIFYVFTLYMGQSVIFIPEVTPKTYEWNLFNVRYGMMMIPTVAVLYGYLFSKSHHLVKSLLLVILVVQLLMYPQGFAKVITWEDGVSGLSASKSPDAEGWLEQNYDNGLVLLDDYARTVSIIRSDIPMKEVVYVGNKPYWDESLREPEKYVKWIVMQKDDDVWKRLNNNPIMQARVYKYYAKAYTSPEILIFKRIEDVQTANAN